MSAIEILREALFAILRNWRQAIQIFLVPIVLVIAISAGVMIFGTQAVTIDGQTVAVPSPFLIVLLPLFLFSILWPVVAWHRLLVLDDQPTGFVPPVRFKSVLRYALNLIGLGFLLSLLMLPVLAVFGPMMISEIDPEALVRGEMLPLKFIIWPALASLPALYLGIRLCLILPGAAVDNRVGLFGSWDYTSGKGTALILIAVFAAAFSIVVQVGLSAFAPSLFEATQTVLTVFQLTQFVGQMLGSLFVISVMSTMFLAFVQNKASS